MTFSTAYCQLQRLKAAHHCAYMLWDAGQESLSVVEELGDRVEAKAQECKQLRAKEIARYGK